MNDNYDILLYAAFWLLFCIPAGYIAGTKGKSVIGYFLLALFFSPVIGIIAALLSGPSTSKTSELEHLADLKAKGALSEDEFQRAKAKVIG